MSVSKWNYSPEKCDGDYCCGDCDLCDKEKVLKRFKLPPDVMRSIDKINGFDAITVEDMEKYISPVSVISSGVEQKIIEERENAIMAQIEEQIGVFVDKEELIKALNYDRDSYGKGFNDGYMKRASEIIRCKDCIYYTESIHFAPEKMCYKYKDNEGNEIGYIKSDNDYCSCAERKEADDDT